MRDAEVDQARFLAAADDLDRMAERGFRGQQERLRVGEAAHRIGRDRVHAALPVREVAVALEVLDVAVRPSVIVRIGPRGHAIEEQEVAGHKLELFVIDFQKDKMRLKVPVAKATAIGMRKLSETDYVDRALKVVQGRARIKRTMCRDARRNMMPRSIPAT